MQLLEKESTKYANSGLELSFNTTLEPFEKPWGNCNIILLYAFQSKHHVSVFEFGSHCADYFEQIGSFQSLQNKFDRAFI